MRDDFDDFFDPFRMLRRWEKFFSELDKEFGKGMRFESIKQGIREPLVDIRETDKELIVTAELPGVDKKDIDLRVKDNKLILKASIKKKKEEKSESFLYKERTYEYYYRVIPLPEYVDTKKIKAKYNNGILEIRIPKVTKKKEEGKIEVE